MGYSPWSMGVTRVGHDLTKPPNSAQAQMRNEYDMDSILFFLSPKFRTCSVSVE